jgi:predicted permease
MTAMSSGMAKRMTNDGVDISSILYVFLMYYTTVTTVMVVFYAGAAKWRHQHNLSI